MAGPAESVSRLEGVSVGIVHYNMEAYGESR